VCVCDADATHACMMCIRRDHCCSVHDKEHITDNAQQPETTFRNKE